MDSVDVWRMLDSSSLFRFNGSDAGEDGGRPRALMEANSADDGDCRADGEPFLGVEPLARLPLPGSDRSGRGGQELRLVHPSVQAAVQADVVDVVLGGGEGVRERGWKVGDGTWEAEAKGRGRGRAGGELRICTGSGSRKGERRGERERGGSKVAGAVGGWRWTRLVDGMQEAGHAAVGGQRGSHGYDGRCGAEEGGVGGSRCRRGVALPSTASDGGRDQPGWVLWRRSAAVRSDAMLEGEVVAAVMRGRM